MKRRLIIGCVVLGLGLSSLSTAHGGPQGDPQARTRLRERVGELYLIRLTRALDLTEEQAARIYPLLTRIEREKGELQNGISADLRELRAEMSKSRTGEERVLELVARIREARRAVRRKDDEAEAGLDSLLTPLQRARYVLFTIEFLRSVGENVQRARGLRAPVKRNP
jgi:hypothetical protein